jgi:hypothetical protein
MQSQSPRAKEARTLPATSVGDLDTVQQIVEVEAKVMAREEELLRASAWTMFSVGFVMDMAIMVKIAVIELTTRAKARTSPRTTARASRRTLAKARAMGVRTMLLLWKRCPIRLIVNLEQNLNVARTWAIWIYVLVIIAVKFAWLVDPTRAKMTAWRSRLRAASLTTWWSMTVRSGSR